jgi:hypothetical protein
MSAAFNTNDGVWVSPAFPTPVSLEEKVEAEVEGDVALTVHLPAALSEEAPTSGVSVYFVVVLDV